MGSQLIKIKHWYGWTARLQRTNIILAPTAGIPSTQCHGTHLAFARLGVHSSLAVTVSHWSPETDSRILPVLRVGQSCWGSAREQIHSALPVSTTSLLYTSTNALTLIPDGSPHSPIYYSQAINPLLASLLHLLNLHSEWALAAWPPRAPSSCIPSLSLPSWRPHQCLGSPLLTAARKSKPMGRNYPLYTLVSFSVLVIAAIFFSCLFNAEVPKRPSLLFAHICRALVYSLGVY